MMTMTTSTKFSTQSSFDVDIFDVVDVSDIVDVSDVNMQYELQGYNNVEKGRMSTKISMLPTLKR